MVATPDEDGIRHFTIDELAAVSAVPSRTIRYYQSKGVLPRPLRRGRVAVYTDEHLDRLRTIISLQDRGLRLNAIRDVLSQVQEGTSSLQAWLGLDHALTDPWLDEEPIELTEAELIERVGEGRDELVTQMCATGLLVPPSGDQMRYLVLSPGLFEIAIRLDREQIDFAVQSGAVAQIREALRATCDELVAYFGDHSGEGFGADVDVMVRQLRALRPLAGDAVRIVFEQEMERALQYFVASGGIEELASRREEFPDRD